ALAVRLPWRAGRGFWHALAYRAMDRPAAVILPVLAVLTLLGAPLRDINLSSPDASILPPNVVSRQGFDQLQKAFGAGAPDPGPVVVKAREPILTKDNVDRLDDFTQQLARDPRIARINGITSLDPRLTKEQYELLYADPARIPDRYAQVIAGS